MTSVLVNAAMGVIYVWGLFLLPLESGLGLARSDLSLVPSLALVSFTAGMVVHAGLLRQMGAIRFALLAFALAGGGHLLFGLMPGYATLLVGYGVLFGVGAGLGYGLALATVTAVPERSRALAVGLTMAAFASSGIVLPLLLGPLVRSASPPASFSLIGFGILAVGLAVVALLAIGSDRAAAAADGGAAGVPPKMLDGALIALAAAFFGICVAGLLAISQAAGMTAANGLSPRIIDISVGLLTVGYLAGSLLGGKLVEAISGRNTLILASVLSAFGVFMLDVPSAAAAIAGALAVGAAFGASASFMPILIGERFGAAQIGHVYGRLMIFYGLAGLLAPWVSGWLFERHGDYRASVVIAVALCALAALLGLRMKRTQ